jgi:hypothetical protein
MGLQNLNKKMGILRMTIHDSLCLHTDRYLLNVDVPDNEIVKSYNMWKQDLIIKYYDPRR